MSIETHTNDMRRMQALLMAEVAKIELTSEQINNYIQYRSINSNSRTSDQKILATIINSSQKPDFKTD